MAVRAIHCIAIAVGRPIAVLQAEMLWCIRRRSIVGSGHADAARLTAPATAAPTTTAAAA
jgi:hypothetical protein